LNLEPTRVGLLLVTLPARQEGETNYRHVRISNVRMHGRMRGLPAPVESWQYGRHCSCQNLPNHHFL